MASSKTLQGYECNFISEVPEDFYCKKCTLVARRLTFISCCSETYCHTCIPEKCLSCGEESFNKFEHLRNQQRIENLLVYCSMKERGCVWSGPLDQLDTHLDPHLDNCQYVDTKCPLNCLQTVPKNKVDQHVAQECTKRLHVCQHCGFKATYEEVVDTHLPECKYVALQCPNMCGVSCEREVMEDHMKTCRLEEVECEFSSVGCDGRFIREDQDEHARQNSQKHLTLTASLAVETKEQLQQKLLEQDKKHKEEEQKLRKKLREEEKKLEEQEKKLAEQDQKIRRQETEITVIKQILKKRIIEHNEHEQKMSSFLNIAVLDRKFKMKNFSKEQEKYSDWKSPAMYTHVCSCKFSVRINVNAHTASGKSVLVNIMSLPGEFDDALTWPAEATFSVELVHPESGTKAKSVMERVSWNKPEADIKYQIIANCTRKNEGYFLFFIYHSELTKFLYNDTLHFAVSVEML